jgi:hypothetical protein
MALPKLEETEGFYGGGIVQLFNDLSIEFSGDMMKEIKKRYNEGYSFEEIGEYTKRDPDEIFLALFHIARQDGDIRPVGRRFK